MNHRERIASVARAFAGRPDLGFETEADLYTLLDLELGAAAALDQPVRQGKISRQALAPESIYHICASTLAVSAETSLLLGLLLGSRLYFKLPSSGLPEFEATVAALPPELREKVVLLHHHDVALMKSAPAVVVFGSDETQREIHQELDWHQKHLAYGHKISLGWINAEDISPDLADRAAQEILAHGQLGCLSPQAYLCAADAPVFAAMLARSLAQQTAARASLPSDFARSVLRRDWILRAQVRGDTVMEDESKAWAVALAESSVWDFGPGGACINVVPFNPDHTRVQWLGRLSSVSYSSWPLPEALEQLFLQAGARRFCPIGQLQKPDLCWQHDGRPRLADLVSWITLETRK